MLDLDRIGGSPVERAAGPRPAYNREVRPSFSEVSAHLLSLDGRPPLAELRRLGRFDLQEPIRSGTAWPLYVPRRPMVVLETES